MEMKQPQSFLILDLGNHTSLGFGFDFKDPGREQGEGLFEGLLALLVWFISARK